MTHASDELKKITHARSTAQDVVLEDRPSLGTVTASVAAGWLQAILGRVPDAAFVMFDPAQDTVQLQNDAVLHGLGPEYWVRRVQDLPILSSCELRNNRLECEPQ